MDKALPCLMDWAEPYLWKRGSLHKQQGAGGNFLEQDRVNILMDFVKQGYYQQAGAFVKQFSEPFYQIIVSQPFFYVVPIIVSGVMMGNKI